MSNDDEYLKTLFLTVCMSNDGEYLKTLFLTVFVWATMVSTSERYFWLYLYEQWWCYEIILD